MCTARVLLFTQPGSFVGFCGRALLANDYGAQAVRYSEAQHTARVTGTWRRRGNSCDWAAIEEVSPRRSLCVTGKMETDFAWLLLLYKCAEQIPRNANAATHNREPLRAQPCMAKGRPRIEIAQSKRRDGTHKWKEGDGGGRGTSFVTLNIQHMTPIWFRSLSTASTVCFAFFGSGWLCYSS